MSARRLLCACHQPDGKSQRDHCYSKPANLEAGGAQLIRWGDEAVPHIVELIAQSTDPKFEPWENTVGEDMIRAYLGHWEKLDRAIDPRVEAAVRSALEKTDPQNAVIRTEYHKEFLQRLKKGPPGDNP